MTEWQYRLTGTTEDLADGNAEAGRAGLIRLPFGGPVALAEQLQRDGSWELTDRLWRIKYEGAADELVEIDASRAEQLVRTWIEIGRIDRVPDAASSIPPEVAHHLVEADRQAAEQWRAVEPPPGFDTITF